MITQDVHNLFNSQEETDRRGDSLHSDTDARIAVVERDLRLIKKVMEDLNISLNASTSTKKEYTMASLDQELMTSSFEQSRPV